MNKLWLNHFGFRFDPFGHGEASRDPNLNRYLIGHEAFSVAWSEAPSMIYSLLAAVRRLYASTHPAPAGREEEATNRFPSITTCRITSKAGIFPQ